MVAVCRQTQDLQISPNYLLLLATRIAMFLCFSFLVGVLRALRSLRWGNDAALRACFGPRLIETARKPEATSANRLQQMKGDGSKPILCEVFKMSSMPDVFDVRRSRRHQVLDPWRNHVHDVRSISEDLWPRISPIWSQDPRWPPQWRLLR